MAAGVAFSGIAKFLDPEGWGRRFEIFGVSSDLLFITTVAEILAVVLLLIPPAASYGAGIIAIVMAVATWSHYSNGVGDPTTVIVYLFVALFVA